MISVIVPVYNGEKYIENCVHMLMNQDYGDFEAIFINDGSTDKTVDLFYQLTKNDKRFNLISIENHGVSYARNLGMKYVKGDFFTFIDCDDYIGNDYLRVLYEDARDSNCKLVICGLISEKSSGKIEIIKKLDSKMYSQQELIGKASEFCDLYNGPCCKLISCDYLDRLKFTNLKYYIILV